MKKKLSRFALIAVGLVTLFAFAACQAGDLVGAGADDGTFGASESLARAAGGKGKPAGDNGNLRLNVVLNTDVTDAIRAEVSQIGRIADEILAIDALVVRAKADAIDALASLSYVASVNPDAERNIPPDVSLPVDDFGDGLSTWNLDVVNVTDIGFGNRQVAYDGEGVYVAVLDTGLVKNWRYYFPEERIAVEYAKSFTGSDNGTVAEQPNKWEHDTDSHGTHVTSTVIGYNFGTVSSVTPINGVAPLATVIPVKVLNNNGSGWSSMVAAGITHIGDLKAGPLADSPVVINMSLGGPSLDAIEKAAIDYAIERGVIIVASAGNSGELGMGYPGAYEPVISVAASGWAGEWYPAGNRAWWYNVDDPELGTTELYYITDFSSRELPGQDLDVAAPGSWVVGPYQLNQGNTSYYFLGGTSMASPHVAGIAALMAQKNGSLVQSEVETILEATALPFLHTTLTVPTPSGAEVEYEWGADATGAGLATADAALAAVAEP